MSDQVVIITLRSSRGSTTNDRRATCHRRTESVVLDLMQARGKQIFLELVAKADVLIENFAVGVMDRLGLGWPVEPEARAAARATR